MFDKIINTFFGKSESVKKDLEIVELVNLLEIEAINAGWKYGVTKLGENSIYKIIKSKTPEFKATLLVYLLTEISYFGNDIGSYAKKWNSMTITERNKFSIKGAITDLLWKGKLNFTDSQIIECLNLYKNYFVSTNFSLKSFIKNVKSISLEKELTTEILQKFKKLYNELNKRNYGYAQEKIALKELLFPNKDNDLKPVFADDKDEVGRNINSFISSLNSDEKANVYELLGLLKNANASKPTNKYIKD